MSAFWTIQPTQLNLLVEANIFYQMAQSPHPTSQLCLSLSLFHTCLGSVQDEATFLVLFSNFNFLSSLFYRSKITHNNSHILIQTIPIGISLRHNKNKLHKLNIFQSSFTHLDLRKHNIPKNNISDKSIKLYRITTITLYKKPRKKEQGQALKFKLHQRVLLMLKSETF